MSRSRTSSDAFDRRTALGPSRVAQTLFWNARALLACIAQSGAARGACSPAVVAEARASSAWSRPRVARRSMVARLEGGRCCAASADLRALRPLAPRQRLCRSAILSARRLACATSSSTILSRWRGDREDTAGSSRHNVVMRGRSAEPLGVGGGGEELLAERRGGPEFITYLSWPACVSAHA